MPGVFFLDFLGNFRSAVLLVSFALCFAPLPCNTPSIAAVESLCTGQNILRIPSLLQIPRKSIVKPVLISLLSVEVQAFDAKWLKNLAPHI